MLQGEAAVAVRNVWRRDLVMFRDPEHVHVELVAVSCHGRTRLFVLLLRSCFASVSSRFPSPLTAALRRRELLCFLTVGNFPRPIDDQHPRCTRVLTTSSSVQLPDAIQARSSFQVSL
jgi:hypothetical protein